MKYKKSIERSNVMKRNKSNNVKTHVNDKTDAADYKIDNSWNSWFTDYKIDDYKTYDDYKTDNDKTDNDKTDNDKTDNDKTNAADYESWFIWSVFAGIVVLAIYSILHKCGII